MWLWFTLTLFSVLFVVWDSIFNGVTSWVQRAAWILVTLYTGPLGVFLYVLACRRPFFRCLRAMAALTSNVTCGPATASTATSTCGCSPACYAQPM